MSFRVGLFIFAVIGLIGSSALGQTDQQTESAQGQAEQQQTKPYEPPIPFPVEIITDQAEADARKRHEEESSQREVADLVAQEGMNEATQSIEKATRDMRDYSLYSTIAVCVGTLLLIWTLILTRQANAAAQQGVKVTREMM